MKVIRLIGVLSLFRHY